MMEHGRNLSVRPSFLRRLAAVTYDALLLLAVWFVATALLLPLNGGQAFSSDQFFYPIYLLGISFGFYGWFWTHGGQTLGLKAWNIRLLSFDQRALNWRQAAYRFFGGVLVLIFFGIGFFWIIFDKNHYAWFDYWSKSTVYFMD